MTSKPKNAITENGTIAGKASGLAESLIKSAAVGIGFSDLGRYMTGSRAVIKVNNKLYGFAFSVTYNIKTEYVENTTIDSYIAYELMPTRISVDGTMSMFHIPDKSPTKQFVQANVASFLMHKYITIEISDQMTGQVVFKTNRAVITNKSQTLTAGELSTIILNWKALGWTDELGQPSLPIGADGKLFPPDPDQLPI